MSNGVGFRPVADGVPSPDASGRPGGASDWSRMVGRRLEAMGYSRLRFVASGRIAGLYVASALDGREVAIRVQSPRGFRYKRERHSIWNYLRLKLTPPLMPRHPNLARFRAAGVLGVEDPGLGRVSLYYVVMDYIEGQSLLHSLSAADFRAGGVARIRSTVIDVLRGWSAIHRRGLRHGDLSPQNIVVERETSKAVLVDLRLSMRLFRPLSGSPKFRSTVRALLTGSYRRPKEGFPPVMLGQAAQYWFPDGADPGSLRDLGEWVAFEESLRDGGELSGSSPPRLLARAMEIAGRQARSCVPLVYLLAPALAT
jgi:hypothetical protein